MRLFALIVLFFAATASAVEPLPSAPAPRAVSDRAVKFAQLRESFSAARQKAMDAQRGVKTKEEYEESLKRFPKMDDYAPQILPLVAENPKDALSFDMLAFVAANGRPGDTSSDLAYRLLAEHHAASDRARGLLDRPGMVLPGPRPFIERVIAVHPDRATRAKAALVLAQAELYASERADGPAAMAAAERRAEAAYRRVVEDFADVKLSGRNTRTAGEEAKETMTELVELGIGKPFPNLSCETVGGKTERIADYKGKVVVVDVWATWCGPCRAMIPHERELVARLKDKPFALIAISGDDEKSALETFLKGTEMPWIHWWGGANKRELLRSLHIRHFPTIYVLDAKGVIRFKGVRGEKMDKAVDALLEEAAKPAGGE